MQPETEGSAYLFDNWFDPVESGVRERVRELIREELDEVPARKRYRRRERSNDGVEGATGAAGHRHGSRTRSLMNTFGKVEITVAAPNRDTGH